MLNGEGLILVRAIFDLQLKASEENHQMPIVLYFTLRNILSKNLGDTPTIPVCMFDGTINNNPSFIF